MNSTDIAKILGKPYFQAPNCLIYNKEYDKSLVLDEYVNWCEQWIAEVYRVTIDRGAFWLNLGYLSIRDRAKAIGISYLLWDKVPFYLIQEVVSNYGAGVAGSNFFSPRNQKFLWYVKNQYKYTFNLDEGLFWMCSGKGSVSVSLTQAFGAVPREVLFL